MNIGPDGEFYILNKRDGMLRRLKSTSGILEGDANRDGTVDGANFLRWQQSAGQAGDWSDGDFNGSKVVDTADLSLWQSAFRTTAPPSAPAAVPEPTTMTLLLSAAAAGYRLPMRTLRSWD